MIYAITDIQPWLNNGFSGFGNVIGTFLFGLLVALAYLILKKVLFSRGNRSLRAQQWLWGLAIVERLFWPLFILILMVSLLNSAPLVGLVCTAIIVTLLFKPFKNYTLGLITLAARNYLVGQRIIVSGQNGSIRSFKALGLEMELDNGSILEVPYEVFSNELVVRLSPKSGVLSHDIELKITKPTDLSRIKQSIQRYLLSLPYVLPDQKLVIENIADEESYFLLKVVIHGIDRQQMYEVEGQLKSKFERSTVKKAG